MRPVAPRCILPALCMLLTVSLYGCSNWPLSSRWAMDDPDYADKYSQPYGEDKAFRMLKQLVDARHVDGKTGWTLGAGAGGSPATAGASFGGFCFPTHWSEFNYSLTGLAGTGAADWFIGPEVGVRIQTPTRVAPFAGVGGFLGINRFYENAENDGIDNDDNGFVDEPGEDEDGYKAFAAVYPEVGIHAWLNGTTRLTLSSRYYVTEEGRADDFWYTGISLSWVVGDDHDSVEHDSAEHEDDE